MSQQPISQLLESIRTSTHADDDVQKHSYHGFSDSEKERLRQRDYRTYQGKVRELVRQGSNLYIYHTDRLSAFDCYVGMVPYKGSILAKISEFWLREAAKSLDTHLLSMPHERVLKCEALEPIKAEVIVRGYMAGSMMRAYEKGEREFCGARLPEGLKPYGPLPQLLITPTTKAEVYEHDENASPDQLIQSGVCTREEWDQIAHTSIKLFQLGQKIYKDRGWILVDTKYEFGRDRSGKIKVIDEIHTPDSSRLWVGATYEQHLAEGKAPEMLDKENVRRWLMDHGFSGQGPVPKVPAAVLVDLAKVYLGVAEKLIGAPVMSEGPLKESPCLDLFLK